MTITRHTDKAMVWTDGRHQGVMVQHDTDELLIWVVNPDGCGADAIPDGAIRGPR